MFVLQYDEFAHKSNTNDNFTYKNGSFIYRFRISRPAFLLFNLDVIKF